MRHAGFVLSLSVLLLVMPLRAQEKPEGPADEKAQKTYREAFDFLKEHRMALALESFKKADKQDGGHCLACQKKIMEYGTELRDWKAAAAAAGEMVAQAQGEKEIAKAHFQLGAVLFDEALDRHKEDLFRHAHEEMTKALAVYASFPNANFMDGMILAYLKQDDAAKAQFEQFIKTTPTNGPNKQRALRYARQPELARARMAPPFAVTTIDGQRLSLDDMQGKVVLIDFWATWCKPCQEALPHIQAIARKFEGQPLIVLSVSLDQDEQKWKDFIVKNAMTWLQYRDGSFDGSISKLFNVKAIPHTFTIDADGVLQEEHIGDASIGTLKKLVARASELQAANKDKPVQ